ncbi:hypothetical protein AMTRI_Chr06g197070 [Amborella trichopoda]
MHLVLIFAHLLVNILIYKLQCSLKHGICFLTFMVHF